MDKIPNEIVEFILGFLNLEDLVNCRKVNKKIRFCSNRIKIDELIIKSDKFSNENFWLNSKRLINHNKSIDFKLIKSIDRSNFNFDLNLKYLFLYNAHFYFENFKILNEFKNLIHLEIFYCANIECDNKLIKLELPNLKICKISGAHLVKIILKAPRLEILDSEVLYSTEIIHPLSIISLYTGNQYEGFFSSLKNLEFLCLRWSTYQDLFGANRIDFTHEFPKLKQLLLIMKNDLYFKQNNLNLKSMVTFNMEQKIMRKIFNFNINYQGVNLMNIDKFNEIYHETIKSQLHYQIQNLDQLYKDLFFVNELNYTDLIELLNVNKINFESIQLRYYYVSHVIVSKQLNDQTNFIKFLKQLKCLKILNLANSQLNYSFYNDLSLQSNLFQLHTLIITEQTEFDNFDFILKFRSLITIVLNQPFQSFNHSLLEPFDRLESLKNFSFIINNTNTIKIIKNNENEFLNSKGYDVFHLIKFKEKETKTQLISNHINFNELITVCNHLIKIT